MLWQNQSMQTSVHGVDPRLTYQKHKQWQGKEKFESSQK